MLYSLCKKLIKSKFIITPKKDGKSSDSKFKKIYIPELPNYNWTTNKELIVNEILFNNYFIS